MEPQLSSPQKVWGGWRGLTYIVVGPDLFELTGIFSSSEFYTNFSLGIMDVVLNIPCSLQMSAFSYLNTHFCSILPTTALLTLHTASLLCWVCCKAQYKSKLFLNRNKTQPCLEMLLPRYLVPLFGSDTPCCHTCTPCSTSLTFTGAPWCGHSCTSEFGVSFLL